MDTLISRRLGRVSKEVIRRETGDRQTASACAGPGAAEAIMRGSEDVIGQFQA
jgi:hypothetical protein